jgi:uncharacterized membrane protein YcaP (DUF421 family)
MDATTLFFDNWADLANVCLTTVSAFVTLFLFVRISGKRTLAKLNAFDFVVTIALGSVLAYMMLGLVPFVEGAIVLALIILFQYIFAWMARSSKKMEHLINSVPTLLYYDGIFIEEAMQAEAVTKEEIYSIIRSSGIEYLEQVRAVVMELNGQISIIQKAQGTGLRSLEDMQIAAKKKPL